jgi:hypothetical protein
MVGGLLEFLFDMSQHAESMMAIMSVKLVRQFRAVTLDSHCTHFFDSASALLAAA